MESAADLVIDATHLPAAEVAERIAVEAEQRMADAASLCGAICGQKTPSLSGLAIKNR